MTELPKCPSCGKEIQFYINEDFMGNYVAICGCTECCLLTQCNGIISQLLSEEDRDKSIEFIRKEMIESYTEMMKNNGIVDKESAEMYLLQICYDNMRKVMKDLRDETARVMIE